MMPVSLSSAVRTAGPALATLVGPSKRRAAKRAAVIAGTDAVARRLGPVGITVVSITPDPGETFSPAKQAAYDAVSTAGWTGLALLLVTVLDRLPLPRPVRALVVWAGLYAADIQAVELMDRMLAKANEAKAKAEQAAADQASGSA